MAAISSRVSARVWTNGNACRGPGGLGRHVFEAEAEAVVVEDRGDFAQAVGVLAEVGQVGEVVRGRGGARCRRG